MYVNCSTDAGQSGRRFSTRGEQTHEWLSGLPPEFLAQELDDGLEAVRHSHLEEVLLHYGRVAHGLEAHDDWGWTHSARSGVICKR